MRLISIAEAESIRRMRLGRMAGCGEVSLVISTGRARCRACGGRIVKGEEALAVVYDFYGGGLAGDPYTGTEIKIHRTGCPGRTPTMERQ